jgi:hypothetical protein
MPVRYSGRREESEMLVKVSQADLLWRAISKGCSTWEAFRAWFAHDAPMEEVRMQLIDFLAEDPAIEKSSCPVASHWAKVQRRFELERTPITVQVPGAKSPGPAWPLLGG